MLDLARARILVVTRGPAFAADVGVNFVLPFIIYSYAAPHVGDVRALLASSIPPIVWSVVEFLRHRRLDAMSVLVLAGIVLSLLAFVGGGGARMLQLREKMVTGVIGLACLVSAAIGRPLIYELARAGMARRGPDEADRINRLRDEPAFRRAMTMTTIVWGFGLLLDVAIGAALLFKLTIKEYMIVSPFQGYALLGVLCLWTFWYSRRANIGSEDGVPTKVPEVPVALQPAPPP